MCGLTHGDVLAGLRMIYDDPEKCYKDLDRLAKEANGYYLTRAKIGARVFNTESVVELLTVLQSLYNSLYCSNISS